MAVVPGPRISGPPRVSFDNLPVGTTPNFVLPAGVGQLQYDALDPNTPGVVTLQQVVAGVTSTVGTLNTAMGDIPNYTGVLWFQTLGGTFNISFTVAIDAVVIYFTENTAL